MPDAKALREIEDDLRALARRAQTAGSSKLRAFIGTVIPVATQEAEAAERGHPKPLRPAGFMRRLGED